MTSGRIIALAILVVAIIAGTALYYLQVYAYFDDVSDETSLQITTLDGRLEPLPANDLHAIDANSSPLRFRACFTTPMSLAMASETYVIVDDAVPLNGPGWFDCYDAQTIGTALENGEAIAFLSQRNIHDGVDRIIAVFPDGRGYAWHQLNEKYKD